MVKRYNEDDTLTDGIFDDNKVSCRERYVDGVLKNTISKMWIETTDPDQFARLDDWMKKPWGYYPPLPPRRKNLSHR